MDDPSAPSSITSISNHETSQNNKNNKIKPKKNETNSNPTVSSLDNYSIPISNSLHSYLNHQYPSRPSEDDNFYVHRILNQMKQSSQKIYCRVNYINASNREELIEILNTDFCMKGGGLAEDTATFRARGHAVLHDCIVLEKIISEEENVIMNLSRYNQPPACHEAKSFRYIYTEAQNRNPCWPKSHRAIICNRQCGESILRGADIFIPGILCADMGIRQAEEVAVYVDVTPPSKTTKSIPKGLIVDEYKGHCIFVGLGVTNIPRADMFRLKNGVAVQMQHSVNLLPSLQNILPSQLQFQNLPSIVVGHALAAQKHQYILDMCAAPGGKTGQIASLVGNDAIIIACDKSRRKMTQCHDLWHNKLGATCIVPLVLNSTKIAEREDDCGKWKSVDEVLSSARSSTNSDNSSTNNNKNDPFLPIKSFYPNSFDRILLDPPCSALGLRPKLHIDFQTSDELETQLPNFQKMFIGNAVSLLKPGGIMTYSTCTINVMENERMVRYVLDSFDCMMLVPIAMHIGNAGLPDQGLDDEERGMVRRFDPCLENEDGDDSIGFFVAKFRKRGCL